MHPPSDDPPSRLFVAGWALLAGLVMFALGVFHNGFPCEYHPDEPAKVAQLLAGTRDYHHPPLMLTLADAAARAAGVPWQAEPLARVGRTLSAAYLAGAVALLTVLAAIYGGTRGAVVTAAAALAVNAQAVLAAHFFKEDALFVLALALTFVAGAIHWRRRSGPSALALGAAAGLAVSSKYVGALAVVYALALVALAAKAKRRDRKTEPGGGAAGSRSPSLPAFCILYSAFCISGLLLVVALCNGAALWAHFDTIRAGWRLGVSTVAAGNGGVGAQVPHWQFVGMLFVDTPLPVLLGAAWFWADLRRFPFRAHADRWLAGLSPLWLTLVFSFSASTAVRYFLPVSLGLGCIAGVALPGAVRRVAARWGTLRTTPAAAVAAGLILLFSLPETVSLT
ncbi:MAG: glycosyltransferase family 39 protein, partial [Gluconacetobacter diazotrophicus]|nr:glycosyltransferase family 39 protein [Gluconacetobacter diazotrophicus]